MEEFERLREDIEKTKESKNNILLETKPQDFRELVIASDIASREAIDATKLTTELHKKENTIAKDETELSKTTRDNTR